MTLSFHLQTSEQSPPDKDRSSRSARTSIAFDSASVNPSTNRTPNLISFDDPKRPNPSANDSSLGQQPFGKTLNVPNSSALQALPGAALPAPLNPHRPAIMTTPRSATATIKSPTKPAGAARPVLMVTTANDQRQPETTTVPNSRRLPLNGRMATIGSNKPRPAAPVPAMGNNHQTVNETAGKKPVNHRARPAVFYASKSKLRGSTDRRVSHCARDDDDFSRGRFIARTASTIAEQRQRFQ